MEARMSHCPYRPTYMYALIFVNTIVFTFVSSFRLIVLEAARDRRATLSFLA